MEDRKRLINKILVRLDSGVPVLDEWKFRYNSTIKGIEAYRGKESIIESQNIFDGINENFEIVAGRLLDKLEC